MLRYIPTLPGFCRADLPQPSSTAHQPASKHPDLLYLHHMAQQFYVNGLAPTTRSTYAAGQHRFTAFCTSINTQPMPTTERVLSLFVTYLATCNISHTTIKVYLSAIRHMHVTSGKLQHFNQQLTPRLQQILKGIRKEQAATHPPKVQLPITLQILQDIKHLLSGKPHSYTNVMTWAACCLAFFGFLRVSEFTIPSQEQYDQSCHLSLGDVSLDNRDTPRLLRIHIKQSKTDPFRRGVEIYLGATDASICPLKGILPYLALRGRCEGPLFVFSGGRGLTRQLFSSMLADLLRELNMDTKHYNTHGFRIGAATSAKMANIPDTYIKMLGRWKSDTYQQYIKTPPDELAKLSKHLISGYKPPASATL